MSVYFLGTAPRPASQAKRTHKRSVIVTVADIPGAPTKIVWGSPLISAMAEMDNCVS